MSHFLAKLRHFVSDWTMDQCWRLLNLSWTLETGIRIDVRSRVEWVIYNDIFVDGEYGTPVDTLFLNLPENPVIVDIGANVGMFAQYFFHRWRQTFGETGESRVRLIGVEGTPRTYRELQRRLAQSGLLEKTGYHNGLVGRRSGEAYISTSFFHGTNSIMGQRSRFGQMVPFLDLETLLPPGPVHLLKCDIEGAEELFLENYPDLLRRVERMVLELHPQRCDTSRCVALLADAGLTRRTVLRDSPDDFSIEFFERAD